MMWDTLGAATMGDPGMATSAGTLGLGPAAGIAIGAGLAGSVLSGMDAKKQAKARKNAIAKAQREFTRIANEEATAQYKAGGIAQGELLNHLRRIAGGQQAESQQFVSDRKSAIDALAGPSVQQYDDSPTGKVAQQASAQAAARSGLADKLGLAQALLSAQDRGRAASSRAADVSSSRAAIPLQEKLLSLAQQRAQTQAALQNALGNVGPSWSGIAGSTLSGLSTTPFLFA